jgi:hypothetical protein
MGQQDARQRLVHFLEERTFRPVLRADPHKYPANRQDRLKDVQHRTESEVERFHNYRSADEVVTNFRRDLSSDAAKKVHHELAQLGLPTLHDVREQFEELARQLGHA